MKKSTLLGLLVLVIRRDLVLAMRRRADVLTTLIFFVMVVSLFPLGVGPEMSMLRKMAPGVLWVAALLSSMLSLGRLFSADYLDGTLEQMMLAPQSLSMLVLGKMAAHWMVSGLPLVLMAPVLGVQFDMSAQALGVLIVGLLLGTPVLSMIGAIGAALTLGLRGGGVLLSLLVLPLCIPVLIFGTERSKRYRRVKRIPPILVGCAAGVGPVFTPWVTAQACVFRSIDVLRISDGVNKLAINWFKYSAPTTFTAWPENYSWFRFRDPGAIGLYIGFVVAPVDASRASFTASFSFMCRLPYCPCSFIWLWRVTPRWG